MARFNSRPRERTAACGRVPAPRPEHNFRARTSGPTRWGALRAALLVLLAAAPALAQNVAFEPLLLAREARRAVAHDGWLYTGYRSGGLVAWRTDDPAVQRHLTPRDGLGGIHVADLAWTGRHLWVATGDGGLTRLTDPGAESPAARVYSTNLASLAVTAVTGGLVGDSERVYYGTAEDGLGVINDGLAGGYYTTDDGLPTDAINALLLLDDVLYVGTAAGLTRFEGNVFTTVATGVAVARLAADAEGRVLAATSAGLYRWSPAPPTWERLPGGTFAVLDLAVEGEDVWALAVNGTPYALVDGTLQATALPDPPADASVRATALTVADGELWLAGRVRSGDMQAQFTNAGFSWIAGRRDATWRQASRLGSVVGDGDGVAFDAAGRAWIGERNGDGVAIIAPDGAWSHITDLASAENDSSGLFNTSGGVLSMVRAASGQMCFLQYFSGLLLERGDGTGLDLIFPGNSALLGAANVRLGAHPEGPLFVMSDDNVPGAGVQVLVEPDQWRRADAWITPDVGGAWVLASAVERRDVIWFAVQGVGLARWDVNGNAGEAGQLTWTDLGDDGLAVVDAISGTSIDPQSAEALVVAPDGTLWMGGGGGVVQFGYAPGVGAVRLQEFREKTTAGAEGLLSNAVNGLAFDRNGHLWVVCDQGLNRIRLGETPVRVDAYTDLANFLPLAGTNLYSANVVSALPGGTYRQIAASPDGTQLVVSSDVGAARLTVAREGATSGGDDALAGLYLYPNPFSGSDGDGRLRLGGLPAGDDATASLEIFNLQGQVVFRLGSVAPDQGFFAGAADRRQQKVAAGLYVVRVEFAGGTAVRTLAIVN